MTTIKEYIEIRTPNDKESIEHQFDLIATKFAALYPLGITVIIPSGNSLNRHIAEVVMSKSKDAELIEGVICKLTTEEVDDIVLDFGSKFREHYKGRVNVAYEQLWKYLEVMNDKRNGTFSRHLIKDPEMRDVLDITLKVSPDRYADYANKINGQHVLIIDNTISREQTNDPISRGQTIQEVCRIMKESYAPKSITVLTLLSKLN